MRGPSERGVQTLAKRRQTPLKSCCMHTSGSTYVRVKPLHLHDVLISQPLTSKKRRTEGRKKMCERSKDDLLRSVGRKIKMELVVFTFLLFSPSFLLRSENERREMGQVLWRSKVGYL